jgi:hypothetical protein
VQQSQKSKIAVANLNTLKIVSTRNLDKLKIYLKGFALYIKISKFTQKIIIIQKYFRKIGIRKKYLRLKNSVIKIQRAYR